MPDPSLLDEMIEDVRELDSYTPEWASEKWDHPAIVARTERRLRALHEVAEHARNLLDGGGDEAVHYLERALARLTRP